MQGSDGLKMGRGTETFFRECELATPPPSIAACLDLLPERVSFGAFNLV